MKNLFKKDGFALSKVLCVSYSPISRDPRVLRQIKWLQDSGIEVDVLGLGSKPDTLNGGYFEIRQRGFLVRVLIYLFATNEFRYRKLISECVPSEVVTFCEENNYDLIHLNDLEFIPWMKKVSRNQDEGTRSTPIAIDLHEYFPGVKGGLLWKLITERFHKWLFTRFQEFKFDLVSTVSDEIAEVYSSENGISVTEVIWNTPAYNKAKFELHTSEVIELVYHGNSGKGRPLRTYIQAVRRTTSPINLNFMVRIGFLHKNYLKFYSQLLGVQHRVMWHDLVGVSEIVGAVQKYDVELAWFPPISRNMHLSLGNKFFEAVQGHLALVIGESPSMENLVEKYDLGFIARGWKLANLVATLDSLNRKDVDKVRMSNLAISRILNDETSKGIFIQNRRKLMQGFPSNIL